MLKNKLLAATGNSDEPLYSDSVFSAYTYTGNGSTQTINNGIDLAGKGGLVWAKVRSLAGYKHLLVDTVRSTSSVLYTDGAAAAESFPAITSFNTDGFTAASPYGANVSGASQVAWTFRKAPKFFDVQTVSHTNGTATNISFTDLGEVGQVIAKITNTSGDWIVWHRGLNPGNNLRLNTTAAQTTTNAWLSVSGTTATLSSSAPTGNYVIYSFAHDPSADGIVQCGSFTTDGSSNATVNLGWEPQYVMVKFSTAGSGWFIFDASRGMPVTNNNAPWLAANVSDSETATPLTCQAQATGFVFGGSHASQTAIYLAIRRPNKPPTSGTQVYNAIARTGTGAAATVTGVGFAPDLAMLCQRYRGGTPFKVHPFQDRLRGFGKFLSPTTTDAELPDTKSVLSFNMDGISIGDDTNYANFNSSNGPGTYAYQFFRRAPGFFDVVCYTGTGVARTVNHSLGVAPELMIIKGRSISSGWPVYINGPDKLLLIDTNEAQYTGLGPSHFNSTYPTSSAFSVGDNSNENLSGATYVAYLFASLPGISKVGSYTGNGTSQAIPCGFTTGARFILIRRTDAAGDWYVWDSVRGIVAANDPHLSLNNAATEVTTDDSVDPDASGFIVNQISATNINVTGATYIFLAVS